jgi:hypothetical protein
MNINWLGYILAGIIITMLVWIVYNQIKEHNLQSDPMLYTLKKVLEPVHPIVSNLKLYKGDSSYTINKERVFLCLYDENGEYYPLNMLLYVLTHEIAHILNDKDIGHTPAFYEKFDELLAKATELGIYNPSIPVINNYCGT